MLRIRIVAAGVVAAVAVVLAGSIATAQTATTGQVGKPLALLAGLRPPHETKAQAKTAHRRIKKIATRKPALRKKLAGTKRREIAAASAPQPPPPAQAPSPAQPSLPANLRPVADTAPPADAVAATTTASPQTAATADDPPLRELVVGGRTVQIATPDQVNALDLAADEDRDAPPPAEAAVGGDRAAAQTVLAAAPAQQQTSKIGRGSWLAQVLAALGGAVSAGAVAWFLIGSGPVRTYS